MFRAIAIILCLTLAVCAVAQTRTPPTTTSTAPATTTAPATARSIAGLPSPTRVTLRLNRASPRQAFEQLFAQAAIAKENYEPALDLGLSDVTITANLVDEPFLVALKEVCRQCRLEPMQTSTPEQIMSFTRWEPRRPTTRSAKSPATTRATTRPAPWFVYPPPATRPTGATTSDALTAPATRRVVTTRPSWVDVPHVLSGPFMIVPKEVTRTSVVSLDQTHRAPGSPTPRRFMRLNVIVMVDPNVRLTALTRSIEITAVHDEHGGRLPTEPVDVSEVPAVGAGEWMWELRVPLSYPSTDSRRIARLSGMLRAAVVTQTERMEFNANDLAKVIGERMAGGAGGPRFTLGRLEPVPHGTRRGSRLSLVVHRDGRDEAAWRELQAAVNDIKAFDERGMRMNASFELGSGHDDQTREGWIAFSPLERPGNEKAPAVPAKVAWVMPTEVRDVIVPVELRDLELP